MHLIFSLFVGGIVVLSTSAFSFAQEAVWPGIMEQEFVQLTARKPTKTPIVLSNGSILVSSVESYDTREDTISACSFIARNNISMLLESMDAQSDFIARGDANRLIELGRAHRTLDSFTEKNRLLAALDMRRDIYAETVFDMYRFVEERPPELQGHRVAVFLGDDDEWYVLDPLDGKETHSPQLFSEFLAQDVRAEWLVRLPGYSLAYNLSYEDFLSTLPHVLPELHAFFQQQYFQIPWRLRYIEV